MAFKLGNAAVSWGSKKQDITALSTTEAEYVAATTAACQGVWLRRMLEECELKQSTPTVIWCGNLSTIAISKNPAHHGRIKHIDIRFHFIRGLISDEVIALEYCKTQLTDIFTKPLPIQKHNHLRTMLGACNLELRGGVEC